jgi:hypothetical protein
LIEMFSEKNANYISDKHVMKNRRDWWRNERQDKISDRVKIFWIFGRGVKECERILEQVCGF